MQIGSFLSSIPEDLYCSLFNQNTIRRLNEILSSLRDANINYTIIEMDMLNSIPKYDVGIFLCLDGERKLFSKIKNSEHRDIFIKCKDKFIKAIDLHLNYSKRKSLMGIEFDIDYEDKSINPNIFFKVKNDFSIFQFFNVLFDCPINYIIDNVERIRFLGAMISRTPEALKVVETKQEMNFVIDRVLKLGFSINNSTLYILNILKKEEGKIARLCYNITKDGLENKFDIEIFDKPLRVLRSFCKIVDVNYEKMLLLKRWSNSNKNNNFEYDCSHIKLCFKFGNLYNIKGYFDCKSLFKLPDLFKDMRLKNFSSVYKARNALRL